MPDGHGQAPAHRGAAGAAARRRGLAGGARPAPAEADIDALYEVFVPRNRAIAAKFADVIPGAAETVASAARARA